MKRSLEITRTLPVPQGPDDRRRIVLLVREPVMRRLFEAAACSESIALARASEEADVLDHVAWSLVDGPDRRRLDAVVLDGRRAPKKTAKLAARLREASPDLRIAVLVKPEQREVADRIRRERVAALALPADVRVIRHIVRELAPTLLDRIVGLVWPLGTG